MTFGGELIPEPVPAEPVETQPSGRMRSRALCLAAAPSLVMVELDALLEDEKRPPLRLPSPSVAVEAYDSTRDVMRGLRGVACIWACTEFSALRM